MEDKQDIEQDIARDIAMIEYYYGVHITGDYPIMKRFNQMESLNAIFENDRKRYGL